MKKIILCILTLAITSIGAFSQNFKKVENANQEQVAKAEKFANAFFTLVKQDKHYEFMEEEAIPQVKSSFTPDFQKNVYKQLKGQFGEFESLQYAESWTNSGTGINIYRFKADFADSLKKLEVRVVLDANEQIAGFFVFPWSDMLR